MCSTLAYNRAAQVSTCANAVTIWFLLIWLIFASHDSHSWPAVIGALFFGINAVFYAVISHLVVVERGTIPSRRERHERTSRE